jgi:tetratricopeptide (TPR) repeat protein
MKYINYSLLILILFFNLIGFSQEKITLEKAKDYKDSISVYSSIISNIATVDPSVALDYSNRINDIAIKNNYIKGVAIGYYIKGLVYSSKLDKEKALDNLNKALYIFKGIDDLMIVETYLAISITYINVNEEIIAFDYLSKAEEISLKNKTDANTLIIYFYISQIYYNYNKIDDALTYLNKALFISKKRSNTSNTIAIISSIGDCYLKKKKIETSIAYYNKAISLCKNSNDEIALGNCFISLGNAHTELKQYDLAEKNYFKGYEIFLKHDNMIGLLNFQYNISNFYLIKKDYQKSIEFAKQYLQQSKQIGNLEELAKIALILNKAYEGLHDIKEAYYYLKMSTENSFFYNENKLDKFNSMIFDFEKKNKEMELLALKQKNELELVKADNKAQYWLIILIGSFSIFLIVLLIYILKLKN